MNAHPDAVLSGRGISFNPAKLFRGSRDKYERLPISTPSPSPREVELNSNIYTGRPSDIETGAMTAGK